MTPWWFPVGKTPDINDSRPWDLTEIVPMAETFWFRFLAVILGILVIAGILAVCLG
ncbi:MAG: hypothetical protein GYA23_03770 [Methanomicrobiales archaeon]|nr:hypothetical protein [Methanomicrobiales archaeon]